MTNVSPYLFSGRGVCCPVPPVKKVVEVRIKCKRTLKDGVPMNFLVVRVCFACLLYVR